jgi:hypothetical protein
VPLTTSELVERVRAAGLLGFSPRQLERWAHLGVVPHAQRVGRGRGRGWRFLWPDEALPIALFVADALAWQPRHSFREAVLWAWLRGAPIALPVIRHYLAASFRLARRKLERQLNALRRREDELLDVIDRAALTRARRPGLRKWGGPLSQRRALMQQVVSLAAGTVWSARPPKRRAAVYEQTWTALPGHLGLPLPFATDPAEVRRQEGFFAWPQLERWAGTVEDHVLRAIQHAFSGRVFAVEEICRRARQGQHVRRRQLAAAAEDRRVLDVLFRLHPAWVTACMFYQVCGMVQAATGKERA